MKKKHLRFLPLLISLLTIFIAVILFLKIKRSGKENDVVTLVDSSLKFVMQLGRLGNSVQFHAESISNYAHGQNKDDFEKIASSTNLVIQSLDSVNSIFQNDSLLRPYLDSLKAQINRRIELSNQIISLGKEKGFKEAVTYYRDTRGYRYTNMIFSSIRQLEQKTMEQLMLDEVSNTQSIRQLNVWLLILRLLILMLVSLILWNFTIDYLLKRRLEKQWRNYNESLHEEVEQKTSEIKRNEERYRTIVEQASDAFFVNDKQGLILDVNDNACKMLGYSKEELCQMSTKDFVQYDNEQQFYDNIERLNKGERTSNERNFKRKDGTLVSVESNSKMMSDGRIIAIVRDITERKQVEEALRASEFNNRMVIENKIMGIAWASADGYVIKANQAFCSMLDYSQDEIKSIHFRDYTHPDDMLKEEKFLARIQKGEINNYVIEKRYRKKDKSYFWAELNLTCYRNTDTGAIEFFIAIIHDIHEQKRFEEALKTSEKKLRQVLTSYGDVFYVIDKNFKIVLINEIAEKKLSIAWNKAVYLGANILDLIPAGSEEPIRECFEKVFAGETIEYELYVPVKELPPWVQISYFPVKDFDGSIVGAYVIAKDISNQKKIEDELRQSIKRFEMISFAIQDSLWEYNVETGELWANETHQHMYGLTKKDPVPTEDMWLERIHPDDREAIRKSQIESTYSDKNIFSSEYRFKSFGDMDYKNIYDRCYILRNEKGAPVKKMGSMVDITERKKIENELKQSEERYRTLIEQASDFIMITDLKGYFIDVNSSLCKTFGYNREEILQMHINDLIDPEQLEDDPIQFDVLATGKVILRERRMKSKSGTIIEVEANVKMLSDKRVLAIARDIRERKKAETEIRKARELSDQIIDSAPGIFYLFNESGVFLRWNKRFEAVTGYTSDEIASMRPWNLFSGDEVDYIKSRIQGVFLHGFNDAEAHFISKDNQRTPFHFEAVKISYENQTCVLGYGIDISESKKAKEDLAESYSAIRHLSEHLQKIREDERTHIAREIHDELGQQLTVMKMDASWLNKKLTNTDENVKQKLRDLLELMDGTVKTVRRISSELRPSLLDDMGLAPAMEWYLKDFEKRASIKTSLNVPAEDLNLADTVKTGLFRIFQESLTNVARHANAKKVNIDLGIENATLRLSITDDGNGFEMEVAKAKKTLGILGMQERSFMMGGNYNVISKPGKGTNIIVTVPYPGKN
ncbi:MAG: PAS domain S-box protein [Bacteroidetes bacterium]|nr:PAS domain S-box protein [Bacteroidota bacterium]